ncbi:MAG: hypothetical protein F4Z19_07030 [Holophagales bacterium]|nr:hypothetical protein [Holophagales bacterium]
MMTLHWNRCAGDRWCWFLNVNLDHPSFLGGLSGHLEGVYVIWLGNGGRTVYVGSGQIANRLRSHRLASWVPKYGDDLLVTWAVVATQLQEGVERYLIDTLQPLEVQRRPAADPIMVNTPSS